MDLTIFIFSLIISFVGTTVFLTGVRKRNERRLETIRYLNKIVHPILIEKHFDIEYWFDRDEHTFLAQGKNFEEILEILKSRFPGHVFLLDHGGFSEKTGWKFVPYNDHSLPTFLSNLIYGKNQ